VLDTTCDRGEPEPDPVRGDLVLTERSLVLLQRVDVSV
jgi:hypothetical protein